MIPALTGIRAVAAAWVVALHFRAPVLTLLPGPGHAAEWLLNAGILGVDIFFVLSGFIIAHTYAGRLGSARPERAYRSYLVNRFARIYPVHLTALVVVLALVVAAHLVHRSLVGSYTVWTFLANVFMLQGISSIGGWVLPSWSISYEGLAYICFPAIAYAVLRLRRARTAALLALVWLGTGTAVILTLQQSHVSSVSTPIALARIIVDFIAGTLIWRVWSLLGARRSRWGDVAALAAVALAVPVLWWTKVERWQLAAIPLMALFVAGVAWADGPVRQALSTRPMVWAGKVSYSLYMVHAVVIMVFGQLLPWTAHERDPLIVRLAILVMYLSVCVIAAAATYHLVEDPARRWLRRRADLAAGAVIETGSGASGRPVHAQGVRSSDGTPG